MLLAGCSEPHPLSPEEFDALTAAYRDTAGGAVTCNTTCGGGLQGTDWTSDPAWEATGTAVIESSEVVNLSVDGTFRRPLDPFEGHFFLSFNVEPQAAYGIVTINMESEDGAHKAGIVVDMTLGVARLTVVSQGNTTVAPNMRLAVGGGPSAVSLLFDCGNLTAKMGGQQSTGNITNEVRFARISIEAVLTAGSVSIAGLTFSTRCNL